MLINIICLIGIFITTAYGAAFFGRMYNRQAVGIDFLLMLSLGVSLIFVKTLF